MHRNDWVTGPNTLEKSTNMALIKCMCIKKTYEKEEFNCSFSQDLKEVIERSFCFIIHRVDVRFNFDQN